MQNRFFEMSDYLEEVALPDTQRDEQRTKTPEGASFNGLAASQSFEWTRSMSVQNRVLIILIENGGVDLGIPDLVDKIFSALKISAVPATVKDTIVGYIRKKITEFTDNLIETAELTLNRYNKAKPDFFGNVVVLRNGNATYQELKDTLLKLSKEQKIIDLFILTHGSGDYIALSGGSGIDGQKIRDIKAANGSPLTIRSVYMMNCVGSSLNKAWIDAGAKVSSGAIRNNYLPEPTMFFFWSNWKAGQPFETAVPGAYRKTINLMNDAVKSVLNSVPFVSSYAGSVNFENFDFVKDSAPVIQGQRSLTISSDDLSFSQSVYNSLATTVLPVDLIESLILGRSFENEKATRPWTLSPAGADLIKRFEGFRASLYNDPVGHCTIGYGTLVHEGNCNGAASEQPYLGGISDAKASELLMSESKGFLKVINDSVTLDLNQNQVDALVSFTYNVGGVNFKQSTLLKILNQGNYGGVPGELKKWTKGRIDGKLVDLPGLVSRRNAEAALFSGAPPAVAQSMFYDEEQYPQGTPPEPPVIGDYSRPFYDTGEHALFGEFLNNAISGPIASVHALQPSTTFNINSVPFTYGQIITMGDFYASYSDFTNAPPAELTRLKTLVIRSENHYKNSILGMGTPVASPGTTDWGSKTLGIGPRYLDLALKNNSHFAPPPSGTGTTTANNRQSWELYHKQAVEKVRAGNNSSAFDLAYPINAFGDHFLTDAFSAGHLVNKEMVMKKFLGNVTGSGGKISSAGDKLFQAVAKGCLAIPAVKSKLAKYETVETRLMKHWNLDTTNETLGIHVFATVLIGILEDTKMGGQEQIANLAVGLVHDYLNDPARHSGGTVKVVPVKNNKGTSWNLTGDGTLSWDKANHINNLEIIQLAVKQSVENLEDAVRNMSTPLATLYQKVWDFVPNPYDPATRAVVDNAISIYTNPGSGQLLSGAIDYIKYNIDTFLQVLYDKKIIKFT